MASHTLDGPTISNITTKEKQITGEARPVKGGPTAQAQKHTGETITDATVSAIAGGENTITHEDAPRADGPTAFVESLASGQEAPATTVQHTGKLDDSTISAIAEAEKRITGQDGLVEGGPTAQAQKHAGEPINRATLHDITEGEKTITHEVSAVKGGPTATAQSELRALSNARLFRNVHHNGLELTVWLDLLTKDWFFFELFITVITELLDLPTPASQPSHNPRQPLRRIVPPADRRDQIRADHASLSFGEDDLEAAAVGPLALHPVVSAACMATSENMHGDVGDLVTEELPEHRAGLTEPDTRIPRTADLPAAVRPAGAAAALLPQLRDRRLRVIVHCHSWPA
ncbi:hypothetical protein DL770_009373 [Monosporascus sp. CRB-9-2]|nr:hypothetical protein DL770_009373 [Monosporascus sp. CRB-9-2]